jgi:hypothetical protein
MLVATYWWSWWDTTWKICLYEFSDPSEEEIEFKLLYTHPDEFPGR